MTAADSAINAVTGWSSRFAGVKSLRTKSVDCGKLPEAMLQVTVANSPTPNPPGAVLTMVNFKEPRAVGVAGVYTGVRTLPGTAEPDTVTADA